MSLTTESPESRDLLALAREGDADAREQLARTHRRDAYFFALHLVGDPNDALDIAQDSMIRFFGALSRFDAGRPVRPWLFAIVRNCARDLWRKTKVRQHETLDEEIPDLSRALADPAADPEQNALAHERRRLLWRAMSRLGTNKREILVLRDFHDLSYTEIAEVLQIPVGTVMSRLHAARKSLHRELCANLVPDSSRSSS